MKKMPTKSLRILIVDDRHLQRLSIEKMLNSAGYHRIAPVESFEQLLIYTRYALKPFDLVLLSAGIAIRSGVDMHQFCLNQASIHHFMIYNGIGVQPSSMASQAEKVPAAVPGLLNTHALQALMSVIDSDLSLRHGSSRSLDDDTPGGHE